MTIAVKHIHNFLPHLSYVPTLPEPDITQKPKRDTDELKQRLLDTWDRILQESSTKTLTSGKHGFVHV